MNKLTPFQKYLIEQARTRRLRGVIGMSPSIGKMKAAVPPMRSDDDPPMGPPEPKKPDPASLLKPDDEWWPPHMPRPEFESEHTDIDDGTGAILTFCSEDLQPWWLNDEVWQIINRKAYRFFRNFPWDGTPEEQAQYFIDFINSLTFEDIDGNPVDMNEHITLIITMLLDWLKDMIENGLGGYDDDGIPGFPDTANWLDSLTRYQRFFFLQRLKQLYNFLHGFNEDIDVG